MEFNGPGALVLVLYISKNNLYRPIAFLYFGLRVVFSKEQQKTFCNNIVQTIALPVDGDLYTRHNQEANQNFRSDVTALCNEGP